MDQAAHQKRMQEWLEHLESIHQKIKQDPIHAKYRLCEEDNEHPYWSPMLFGQRINDEKAAMGYK